MVSAMAPRWLEADTDPATAAGTSAAGAATVGLASTAAGVAVVGAASPDKRAVDTAVVEAGYDADDVVEAAKNGHHVPIHTTREPSISRRSIRTPSRECHYHRHFGGLDSCWGKTNHETQSQDTRMVCRLPSLRRKTLAS